MRPGLRQQVALDESYEFANAARTIALPSWCNERRLGNRPVLDMARVLYLSQEGMAEPLGQSQVLSYLRGLAACGHQISLISYEQADVHRDKTRMRALRKGTESAGIHWYPLRYRNRPAGIATAQQIALGTLLGSWICLRRRIGIVHARSYVMSVVAIALCLVCRARYLFDMRGLWPEDRLSSGQWSADSRMYRLVKWFERRFFRRADAVVSLTQAAVPVIRGYPEVQQRPSLPIAVIPTCTDLDRFKPTSGADPLPPAVPFILGYVGSLGTCYLLDEMLRYFLRLRLRRPDARMIFLNRHDHALIRASAEALGVPADALEIGAVAHADMPSAMRRLDASVMFIRSNVADVARLPTKLGELLGCGIPVISNSGLGDVPTILAEESVGVTLDVFDTSDLDRGVDELLALTARPDTGARCRIAAERHFALPQGIAQYDALYRRLRP
jgi:glycosyltransferase involved in cell wall biosynthesis